jgi:hypothetical protein
VYTQVPNYSQNQEYQKNYYGQAIQPNPIPTQYPINKIKKIATSPLYLVSIIIYTIAVFFQLTYLFETNSILFYLFKGKNMLSSTSGINFYSLGLYNYRGIVIALSFLAIIPMILICIGLWMFYASSRNPEDRSTAGLSIIKVSVIINFIKLLILPVLIMIVALFSNSYAKFGYVDRVDMLRASVDFFVILVIICILPIIYYISIIRTINQIQETIVTGVPSAQTSRFLGVMNCILAGFTFLMIFFSNGDTIFTSILMGTFLIMISIGLFDYKREMTNFMPPPQNINYGINIPRM